jgi:catechol 2,3-dioxygenase-like lactoylglutathione lyase family enzyme
MCPSDVSSAHIRSGEYDFRRLKGISKMENTGAKEVQVLKAHLALNVKNVERSIEFYKKMLGIEPLKVRRGYAKFDVQNPPLNLTLNQVAFGERGALSHLGLQVASTEDVLAMRQKWGDAGLVTRDEMQTNCCYATQDKSWVTDPDGNEWEVFVVLKDNLAETTVCCGTGEAEQPDVTSKEEPASASACSNPTASASASVEGSCGCGTAQAVETVAASSCCAPSGAPVALSR